MKQTLTYQPHRYGAHSCRLRVEGFPDVSTGQGGDAVGIVTGWSLEWVGHPQLEGRREHLQALMATVIPYARNLLSGVPRPMGGEDDPVTIAPDPHGLHHMQLRSSQPNTPPLELDLDDAELADLVRVLDQCRLDPRMQLPLPVPEPLPLAARELRHRLPLRRRLAAPVGGLAALALAAGASTLLPTPRPSSSTTQAAKTTTTGKQDARPAPAQLPTPPTPAPESKKAPPQNSSVAAASTATSGRPSDEQLKRLRGWLLSRTPSKAVANEPQVWQLAVNAQGEVVAATAVEDNDGQERTALGLPSAEVPSTPAGDTLHVRGVLQPSGFWELSPWHGW
ncbi:MAG: DUF4335 domain-containing protein [Cyanobacteriota bacterium]|jgi:hypothetical protein